MNILIIGSGMYVTGRGGYNNATVLASLAETGKTRQIGRVVVTGMHDNEAMVDKSVRKVNRRLNTDLAVEYVQFSGDIAFDVENITNQYEFDCAILVVPDHLHYSYAKELLNHNLHILVAKPFVTNIADAQELISLQEAKQRLGMVEFHKRFDEANLYTKKILSQNQLGDISYITVDYSQRLVIPTDIFRAWSEKTNIFQYLGVHYVDLIHFFTEAVPVKLMAIGTKGILTKHGVDSYDSIHVTIEWAYPDSKKTFLAIFNTNWIDSNSSSAMSDQKFKIVGEKGRLDADQKNRGIQIVNDAENIRDINPYFSEYLYDVDGEQKFSGYGYQSISQFIKDVADVDNGRQTLAHLTRHRASFRNASVSVAVSDAVNKSLDNNQWVEVKLIK
jgi:predicted dehydrogenase